MPVSQRIAVMSMAPSKAHLGVTKTASECKQFCVGNYYGNYQNGPKKYVAENMRQKKFPQIPK